MKTMLCKDCQFDLIENPTISPDAQAHLASCAECRAFAKTLALAVPPKPAPALERNTLAACQGILAAKRQLPQRRARASRYLLGLAAAAALLLSVALFHLNAPKGQPLPSAPVAQPQQLTLHAAEYDDALSWDIGLSLSTSELDQVELDLELLTAGL